jgi:hypothetical protein
MRVDIDKKLQKIGGTARFQIDATGDSSSDEADEADVPTVVSANTTTARTALISDIADANATMRLALPSTTTFATATTAVPQHEIVESRAQHAESDTSDQSRAARERAGTVDQVADAVQKAELLQCIKKLEQER